MAYQITENTKRALENIEKQPQIILKIDGIDEIFGCVIVEVIARYDEDDLYYDQPSLYYDGFAPSKDGRDWVNAQKSTNSISQQVEPDKASNSSTSSMVFEIIDKGGRMSEIISPEFELPEILGRKATAYYMLRNTGFSIDAIVLMYGTIEEVLSIPTSVRITVNHPQNLLRQEVANPWTAKLINYLHYRSSTILNKLLILQRDINGPYITVNILNDVSEFISVVGLVVNVHIEGGVSTWDDIASLINKDSITAPLIEAESLVDEIASMGSTVTFDSNYIDVDNLDSIIEENADTSFKNYFKIEDEIIKIDSIDFNLKRIYFTLRSQLNSNLPKEYEPDTEISSFYTLQGNAIDLSLKLMLSKCPDIQEETCQAYGYVNEIGFIKNAIYFYKINIKEIFGLVADDFITVDTLFTNRKIVSFGTVYDSSYIIVDGADIGYNLSTSLLVTFKTQYDTLPLGGGLNPVHVDIQQYKDIRKFYFSFIPNLRLDLKEPITLKEYLEEQLYFVSSLYSVPRKGRISIAITRPSTLGVETKVLDPSNILNPENNAIARSLNYNYYNSIQWFYDKDPINDEFLTKNISVNQESIERFRVGRKPLTIESEGLRSELSATTFIRYNSRRFLDRYKFAAESLKVTTQLGAGLELEISDTVIFGHPDFSLTDINTGNRDFQPRIFEIINKTLYLDKVDLFLLETKYKIDGRYGGFSPSSKIKAVPSLTEIELYPSYSTALSNERDKWTPYIGQMINIHSNDWTYNQTCKLESISFTNDNMFIVSGLTILPSANFIVDMPKYNDDSNYLTHAFWKGTHCFSDPQVSIAAVVSTSEIVVSAGDISKFLLKQPLQIHNNDFTIDSEDNDYSVKEIIGNNIKLNKPLLFLPIAGFKIDLIGFRDNGKPYRYI
jgi:hypothetical protein